MTNNQKCRLSVELTVTEKKELENLAAWKGQELGIDMSISQFVRFMIREFREQADGQNRKQAKLPGV